MGAADNKPKSAITRADLLTLAARKNVDAVIAYLTRRLRNFHDAQDVSQSSFMAIVSASDENGVVDNPFGYFSTVVDRELAKFGSARAKECEHIVSSSEIGLDEIAVRSGSGGDPSEELDQIQRIEAAMAELSPRRALVLYLVEYVGLSYQEVGEQIGITTHAVKKILQRAREQLRRRLSSEEER